MRTSEKLQIMIATVTVLVFWFLIATILSSQAEVNSNSWHNDNEICMCIDNGYKCIYVK